MNRNPNVICFTWHDAGDWFGCYGNSHVDTPHVDRLAREGVRFADNQSACAICSPSRAAIATGRFCQANGVMTLTNSPFNNRIHPHLPHLARRFRDLGYHTALFGVQHEAAHEHVPAVMGYAEEFATDPWPHAGLLRAYVGDWLRAQAGKDRPFFAQMGTIDAHLNRFYSGEPARDDEPYPPVQDTRKGLTRPGYLVDSEASRATVATLQGLLHRGDALMGTVLDALDASGLAENTIVCMNVDHGVGLPRAKASCYEAGTRTAWILRWPAGLPAGGVVDALTTHVDVLPTLWDLLGQAPLPDLDGRSLADHARGRIRGEVHDVTFAHMVENTRSIRTKRWRLIRNFRPQGLHGRRADAGELHATWKQQTARPSFAGCEREPDGIRPAIELYDIQADPDCLIDRADDPACADLRRDLDDRLWSFLLDQDDPIVHDPVRSPWQRATRADLEAFCRRRGRRPPRAEGPLGNAIDAASARGAVAGR